MDTIVHTGQDIMSSFGPTFQAYGEMLRQPQNPSSTQAASRETFSYGLHERQKLDLYSPSDLAPKPASTFRPILIFAHGGTSIPGERMFDSISDDLAYENLGCFFAETLGFYTIVMNHSLISHRAKFPGGTKEVAGVMDWAESRFGFDSNWADKPRDVFILGNSAGAVHVSTWLFDKRFILRRQSLVSGVNGVKLTGLVFQRYPFSLDFRRGFNDMLQIYFGDEEEAKEAGPTMLAEEATLGTSRKPRPWPQLWIRET